MSRQVKRVNISGKEDKSNKVTSLSENSTNTQYPSAKTVYDELMTVKTVTPTIGSGGSSTMNNVTKNWHYSGIKSSDLEYFEKIVYNITFEDNDFQMLYQAIPSMGGGGNSDRKIIYFDGTDCYWGIPNNDSLTKGSLICEGNTIQATLNKDRTVTIGDTITNWEIGGEIIMFGNVDFTYTIYSHKYLDADFTYVFEDQKANKYSDDEYTINSTTKNIGEYYFNVSSLNNIIETTYTFTFNDNDFSYLSIDHDYTIFFDGTDCYWGHWDYDEENDENILIKGNIICEGNVVQAVHKSTDGSNEITFSDGTSTYFSPETYYFGDVSVKRINKAPKLEYAQNKKQSLSSSYYDESIVYPSVSAVKNYAEDKSNKVTSWSNTTTDAHYPSEKLVKDSLDNKISKSSTSGLMKNDGTVDTNTYLTSHQSLNGYLQTSDVKDNLTSTDTDKPLSAKQGKELKTLIDNKPTVTVDSTWVANSTNPIQSKVIKTALDNKLDKTHTSYKGKNVVTNASTGAIEFEEKNNHTHSQYLTSHQDISGKEDKSNKVTSLDAFSTDTEYPSAKAVYDEIWTDLYGTIQSEYVPNGSLGNLAYENDVDLSGHDLDELSDNTNLLFSGDYDDLDNKPTIPTATSDLDNDSGFLTSHQSLTGYLQQSDVKDNLTSTDTNKPLSALQGKQLKTLIDSKEDNIEILSNGTVQKIGQQYFLNAYSSSNDMVGKLILYKVPNISSITWANTVSLAFYNNNQTAINYQKPVYKGSTQLTYGDIQSNAWLLLAYDGTTTSGQWYLVSSSSYADTRQIPNYTSELVGDYLEDSGGSSIFSTFNGGYNYANETITYTSSDNKVSYTHDYGMWEDSSGELANLNDLNKTYHQSFTGNENIINKSFDYNWGVKFTYNKTNTTNIDAHIQLGEDTDTCILVGVMENTSSIKLFDNLLSEEWDIILPNANSFDIRIWQVWNEDDLENNTGQDGETYRCTTYLYVDGNTSEFISSLMWTPSFNVKDLERDVIYKVVQDTNSRITDLTFSTDGVYVEKADLNNNSTSLDSLFADMIDYGMDNDSEW